MHEQETPKWTRAQSFAWCVVAYVVAIVAAVVTFRAAPFGRTIPDVAAADLVATIAIFGFSVALRNSSMYDAYWSVAPPLIGLAFLGDAPEGASTLRQVLCLGLCTVWAVRLTYNWARGWAGLHHEDWRYVMIREKTGALYWPASFLGIHLFPTVQVFAGCLAMYPALTSTAPFGALDVVATVVTALAIACEAIADDQLRAFALRPGKAPGSVMREGLWAYSRHPNYFGEMSFWWGLFLFGFAASPGDVAWIVVGALAITVMFVFVSVPMIEKRQLERKPAFREHVETTSMLVPWLPKRR